MSERIDPPRPAGWEDARWSEAPRATQASPEPRRSALERFLGGSPGIVLVRLIVVSLIVGALLMWLDIRPGDILFAVERFFHRIWMLGFDAVREIIAYVLAGAVIVVPIWLVMRVLNMRRQ
ncbi:MAG TPA: DUF6460 domain-containing protein [Beijerinckiaceae bacterium]